MPKKRYNAEDIIHKLREAHELIDKWRVHYNTIRPHSATVTDPMQLKLCFPVN